MGVKRLVCDLGPLKNILPKCTRTTWNTWDTQHTLYNLYWSKILTNSREKANFCLYWSNDSLYFEFYSIKFSRVFEMLLNNLKLYSYYKGFINFKALEFKLFSSFFLNGPVYKANIICSKYIHYPLEKLIT
jgi:hypothetical protein